MLNALQVELPGSVIVLFDGSLLLSDPCKLSEHALFKIVFGPRLCYESGTRQNPRAPFQMLFADPHRLLQRISFEHLSSSVNDVLARSINFRFNLRANSALVDIMVFVIITSNTSVILSNKFVNLIHIRIIVRSYN